MAFKSFFDTFLIIILLLCSTNQKLLADNSKLKTKVIILGSGTPNNDPNRMGPGVAITYKEKVYIFDAGEGILRRANEAGIEDSKINLIFLTHLHSDHTNGISELILSPPNNGRETPITIYGPPGTHNMCKQTLEAFKIDITMRVKYEPDKTKKGFQVIDHEIFHEGIVYVDEYVTISAIKVSHGFFKFAYGYKITAIDGAIIVISGDTTYNENLIENAKDCDILIHEVYANSGSIPNNWLKYLQSYHTSAYELGKLANLVKPKLLVAFHLVNLEKNLIKAQIKKYFQGNVVIAEDLDEFIPKNN